MILEKLADIEPSTAARKRRRLEKSEASHVGSHKVRPRKHVVVIVDGNDHVAALLVRVQDTHIAPLDATPRQVCVQFRVLHNHKMGQKTGAVQECTLDMYAF
jgi:hypothetical protein